MGQRDCRCGCHVTDRKLRLFACACCRAVWHLLTDERSQHAVEVAERYADGLATQEELIAAWKAAWDVASAAASDVASAAAWSTASAAAWSTAWWTARAAANAVARAAAWGAQAALLRDIAGNPFRPVVVDLAWLTPTVVTLASAAYEERLTEKACPERWCAGTGMVGPSGTLDPVRLAILADALEEAGCAEEDCTACGGHGWTGEISLVSERWARTTVCESCKGTGRCNPLLIHLRSPGPHVRGCWAVDLVLGKEQP